MVQTVALCKKGFCQEKSKMLEQEADTNFISLFELRNMIQQILKTYLHRPTKILQFLTPGRIQRHLT